MNEPTYSKTDFINIYNKSYRLASAVFLVSNVIDQDDGLKTKIKKLSLDLVSLSVNLKDTNINNANKLILDIEKNCLELVSMLDIASVAGLISKMNGDIIKEEFKSFISELERFAKRFEENKNVSVKSIFTDPALQTLGESLEKTEVKGIDSGAKNDNIYKKEEKEGKGVTSNGTNGTKGANGFKRKDLRKNMILDFIKGHQNVGIKDIVPKVTGCSEKTVQRELIALINEGKIKKVGERRWSKYYPV